MQNGRTTLKQLPAAALAALLATAPAGAPAATGVAVTTTFAGMAFNDSGNSIPQPPDTHVAVGPAHIVEVVNTTIAVYAKATGAELLKQDLLTFFGPVAAGPGGFDPSVSYDELAGRFIVIILQVTVTGEGSLLYAVSDTSNPLDGFSEMHGIRLDEAGKNLNKTVEPDFPRLGWNADAHVIAMTMFAEDDSQRCDHVTILVIDKSTVLDADPATFGFHHVDRAVAACGTDPVIVPTMVPAVMHGAARGGPMWFVEETNPVAFDSTVVKSQVRLTKMTNVLNSAPTFATTDVTVNDYSTPPDANQPDGPGTIQTNDGRLLSAAWRGGRLVAAHNVGLPAGSPGQALARWYEFDTSGTPGLTQQGTINPGAGIGTYYPSIEIAANGDLGMTFMQSSSSEFVSMYVTGRTSSDAPGAMHPAALAKAGTATYKGADCFNGSSFTQDCLTGDFSGISLDPSSTGAFCAGNEFAASGSSENWATWIACFTLGDPAPTGHDLAIGGIKAPRSVKAGGGTLPVTVRLLNHSGHSETIAGLSVLGDGETTGLVRLAVDVLDTSEEGCQPAGVALNNGKNAALFSKGPKVLKANGNLTVNFLVTYGCASPQPRNKLAPDPGDYSHSATVHAEELDGADDSNSSNDSWGPVFTDVVP